MKDKTKEYKILTISECKAVKDGAFTYLEGYANTKGVEDRYGDIPAVYAPLRNFCYDLSEYQKNPVLLIDHVNKMDHVAGSMEIIREDAKGLYFKARFSNSDLPNIKHTRDVYSEGHAKGISISGQFLHEDEKNPQHLTLAKIFEISCVPVGADPNALAAAVSKALKDFKQEEAAPVIEPIPETELEKNFKALQRLGGNTPLPADELRSLRTWTDELRAKLYGEYFDPQDALKIVTDMEKSRGE